MRISVGIDIAKDVHWVTAIDADGTVHLDRKVENTPTAIATLIDDLVALGGALRIGIDVVGGIAGLIEAMLAETGFALVHVPGWPLTGAPGQRRRREQVRSARRPRHRRPGTHAR